MASSKTRQSLAQPDIQFGNETGIPPGVRQKLDRLTQSVRAILDEFKKVQQAMAGGTAGQVLEKTGAGDYAAAWEDAAGGTVTGAENLGPGEGLFVSLEASLLGFRTLIAGANITFAETPETLTIAATGGGAGEGTVTSVGIASDDLSVVGTPITEDGVIELEILPNAVTNPKLAQMPALSIKANPTAVAADPDDITPELLASLLPIFTPTDRGLVPPPGTPIGAVLTDDGSWQVPFGQFAMKDPVVVGVEDEGLGVSALQDTSVCVLLPAHALVNLCQSWRVAFRVQAGTDLLIASAVLLRADRYTTTFIDSTPILYAGLATFTLVNDTDTLSDPIAVPLDHEHDYYVMFYVDPAADPGTLVPLMADSLTGLQSAIASGDHTADPDTSAFTFSNTVYGLIGAFVETGNGWGSPLTTLGDIMVHDGATDVRLGVGADDDVLTADSSAPDGVAWKPPTGSASPLTTLGDLFGFSTVDDRVPVGLDDEVLAANSASGLGVSYRTMSFLLGLSGITDGWVLQADSGSPTGFSWIAPSAGSSPLTTKGDLFTHSTVDARLPVGTDGQKLVSDSLQTTGLRWVPDNDVSFALLHFDGSNGQTTTVDSSANAFTVTRIGSATLSTTQVKFGTTSGAISTTDGWSIPAANIQIADALCFTLDFWLYMSSLPGSDNPIIGQWTGSGATQLTWLLTYHTGNHLSFYYNGANFPNFAGPAISTGAWHHIALVRNGALLYAFVDGLLYGTPLSLSNTLIATSTSDFEVGAFAGGVVGFVDEIRLVKGANLFNAAFTAPAAAYDY